MTFASYAQNYEDLRLWRALSHIESGCYLDIGAQDPVRDSVSKAFYDVGWRGAHVEATPIYAAALRANRPDEPVFEVAIGDHPGPMTFYEFPDTGMSTGVAEIARAHSERGYAVRLLEVPVLPLSKIFADFGAKTIHWMKIDVEGMERDVISSWVGSSAKPWVLVIESVHPTSHEPSEGEWIDLVLERGYQEVAFDGLSRYFVADEHIELGKALAAPPNIFDDFSVSRYHFSSQRVVAEDNATIQSAHASLAQAQAELNAEQGRYRELQATVAALAAEREESEAALAESLRADLDTRLSESTAGLAALQTEVAAKEEAAQRAEAARADLDATLIAREVELAAARTELAAAKEASQHAESARAELDATLKAREAELAQARSAIGRLEVAARQAESRLADIVTKHDRANTRAAALRSALLADYAAAKRSSEELRTQVEELRSRPQSSAAATIQLLEARITALERENHRGAQDIETEGVNSLTWERESLDARDDQAESVIAHAIDHTPQKMDTECEPMTLDDLLDLHDDEFVRQAYAVLLEREAEGEGLRHYTQQLRRGVSRIRVLADIARSREARNVNARVAGMRKAIRHQRMRDLFMLRPLGSRLFGGYREGDVITRVRAIENRLATLGKDDRSAIPSELDDAVRLPAMTIATHAVIADVQPSVAPAPSLPIVTMDPDRMVTVEQWLTVTQGLFERHWPDHRVRLDATNFDSYHQLWIIVAGDKKSVVATHTLANLRALRGAAAFDVEFGSLGPHISIGKNFTSVKDLAKTVPAHSLVMFIGPEDSINIGLLAALILERAWERDFIVSDQTYQDGHRIGLIPFHGIDHYHLAHVDYFWSRYFVSGIALSAAAKSGAKSLLDVSRQVVGGLRATSRKLLHLQFPFIGNGELSVEKLRQSRTDTMRQISLDLPAANPGWDASVSVVVNTKDGGYLLDGLVHQLLAIPRIAEVLIVSNNTSGDYTLDLLDRLSQTERCSVFSYDQPFNFSVQCNIAARAAKGEFLLFLNDDISLIGSSWLDQLLEDVDIDQSRIAGPLMLYPNQSIQHGGMYLGHNNTAGHAFRHQKHPHDAPMYELVAPRLVSCLTGACLLMRRSLFENFNGFDEQLATGLQDVDLALRALSSGVELVFDPRAIIFHLESVSLIPTLSDGFVQRRREREYARFSTRWDSVLRSDRWHNRNFHLGDESLRSIRMAD